MPFEGCLRGYVLNGHSKKKVKKLFFFQMFQSVWRLDYKGFVEFITSHWITFGLISCYQNGLDERNIMESKKIRLYWMEMIRFDRQNYNFDRKNHKFGVKKIDF